MKLIKALAASAFSAALFAPSAFANSAHFDFSHSVDYTCSIPSTYSIGTMSEIGGDVIEATVENIEASANDGSTIQYASSNVVVPDDSVTFTMKAVTGNGNGGTFAALASEEYSAAQKLTVRFNSADEAGQYSARVTATCVQTSTL